MKQKSSKGSSGRREVVRLEDIPNIGPAIAADLRRLGFKAPAELPGRDPYAMYDDLCRITGQRHDPCLLDTFIAAVRFMEGGPKKPWWKYTAERKRTLAARSKPSTMSNALIRRLKERIQSEPTVDVELHFGPFCPPIRPRPPVSEQTLAEAEAQLGFPLPPLVRALYTQVADGGYGPGYGVIQLTGHPYTLVESRLRMDEQNLRMDEENVPEWVWPKRLVQFVNWGDHYFSGIDCSNPSCPVFFYDNDRGASEDATLADCLSLESDSLMEWLSAWLDGEDLWERGTRCGLHS